MYVVLLGMNKLRNISSSDSISRKLRNKYKILFGKTEECRREQRNNIKYTLFQDTWLIWHILMFRIGGLCDIYLSLVYVAYMTFTKVQDTWLT
jgi:hypothetical protein